MDNNVHTVYMKWIYCKTNMYMQDLCTNTFEIVSLNLYSIFATHFN